MNKDKPFTFKSLVKNQVYEMVLVKPATGVRYKQHFVRFEAFFELDSEKRRFSIIMPINKVLNAFDSIPVRLKKAEYLKIRFRKVDKGEIDIIKFEEYDGNK